MFAKDAGELVGTIEDMDHLYSTYYKISVGAAIFTVVHVILALMLLVAVSKVSISVTLFLLLKPYKI